MMITIAVFSLMNIFLHYFFLLNYFFLMLEYHK